MTESFKSPDASHIEASLPGVTVPLESILCTDELRRRPWRPPDYEKENRALVALLSALLHSQSNILQILADTILDVTQSDSSGLSLLMKDGKRFYGHRWHMETAHWRRDAARKQRCVNGPTGWKPRSGA